MKTAMIITVLIGVLARFMGDEVKSWFAWLHRRIRRIAVAKLPEHLTERYQEEWESALEDVPGEILKLCYSIGLLRAAADIHKAAQETTADQKIPVGQTKRLFDIVFSAGTILVLLPSLLAIAIAIKIESAGPIFSLSERIGKRGRKFHIAKFRTTAQKNEEQFAKPRMSGWGDEVFEFGSHFRATYVGRFLRRYSLHELPIMFSVLKGDMSLVGPRPLLSGEMEGYEVSRLSCFNLSPGVTGLWALRGQYDQRPESVHDFDENYARQWSFWLDIKIIVQSMVAPLTGDQDLEDFDGR
jgi:lipopolysaccharide/colanic/teichoic acid biosynthesis glycosyltransferase